jgi:iron complex outermembrane receptor protein
MRSRASLLGLSLLSLTPFALAQQATDQATGTQELEKIEVTGSYIRRADVETPSPVQVITTEDIRHTGYTTVTDVLNNITANNSGTLSQGFAGAFAAGASGIALRGLTVGATLVLIDGHRMAPYPLADDGQRSFVDLSSIPLDAIERIEVLKDGASSTYGSDAIAGVVNVILKKSFKGATISAENGWSQLGGGQTSHLTGTIGFGDLSEDGQNGFISVEYRHQDPILLQQRPNLFRQDWTALGGANETYGAWDPVGGVTTPASTTGYFVNSNPNVSAIPANFGFLPGCNAVMLVNNQCQDRNEYWQQIEPETQNLNVLARYSKKLGGDWEATFTGSFFQSQAAELAAFNPPIATGATTGFGEQTALVNGKPTVVIYANSGPFMAPVPANVAAQFGVPVGTLEPIQISLMDVGAPVSNTTTQTYRFVGDLKGKMGSWDVDASYGWTKAVMTEENTGYANLATLANDLADGVYVPGAVNSASVINSIAPAIYSQFSDILYFAGAHGNRDLWQLAGGPLSMALGADFYFRTLDAMPSALVQSGQYGTTFAGDSFAQGNQSDWSAFLEFAAPLLKSLEVDAAARYDHYNSGDSATTPKVGFKWTPINELALRGTYSKGFRAPNPVENGSSASLGFAGYIADPVLCPNPSNPNAVGNFPSQCNIPGTALTVSNPALQNEHSTSYTFGILLEPLREQSLGIDFYDIKITNQIISGLAVPSVVAASPITRGPQQTLTYESATGPVQELTPVGVFGYYDVPYVNLFSTETRGLEFELKDVIHMGDYGKLKSDLMFTHMMDYLYTTASGTYDLAGTHGPSEISGDTGTPRNRAKYVLSWEKGPVDAALTVNYIGTYDVTDPSQGWPTCLSSLNVAATPGGAAFPTGTTPPAAFCKVPSFTDFDLYGGWNVDKNWYLHANIQNLFGREPPLDIQTYASTNFNPSLHMEGAIGRFFNIGFRYTW